MGGGGGSADFAYMLLFGFVCIEASLLLLFYQPFMIFTEAIMFYICYVWSRKNPGMSVSFWGVHINALFVPWVMIALRYVRAGWFCVRFHYPVSACEGEVGQDHFDFPLIFTVSFCTPRP